MARLTLTNGWTMVDRNIENVAKATKEVAELKLNDVDWQIANKDGASLHIIGVNINLRRRLARENSSVSIHWRTIISLDLKAPLIGITKLLQTNKSAINKEVEWKELTFMATRPF